MNKNKIAGLVLAGAIISGAGAASSAIKSPTKTKNTTKNEVLLSSDQSTEVNCDAVVINGDNSLVLTNNVNGSIISYLSAGEMLHVTSKEGNYYKVTVKETGVTGFISAKNVELILNGTSSNFLSLNENGHVINVSSEVHLRGKASLNSNIIGFLKNGDNFKIIGKEGQWYKIDSNGHIGFIFEEYVGKDNSEEIASNTITENIKTSVVKNNTIQPTINNQNKNSLTNSNIKGNSSNTTVATNNTEEVTNTTTKSNKNSINNSTNTSSSSVNNQNENLIVKNVTTNTTNTSSTKNSTVNNTGNAVVTFINTNTSKPLVNTTVSINGKTLLTNSKGEVNLIKLQSGQNTLFISSSNFNTTTLTMNVETNKTTSASVKLTPDNGTAILTFVSAEHSRALSNVNISIDGTNYTTNSKGEIALTNLNPGNQTLTVLSKGYNNTSVKLNVSADSKITGNVILYPKVNLLSLINSKSKISVNTENKSNVSNSTEDSTKLTNNKVVDSTTSNTSQASTTGSAVLTFINANTSKPESNTTILINGTSYTTNSNGAISLNNLKVGNQTLTVSSNGFNNTTVKVNITPNGNVVGNVNIYPEAKGISNPNTTINKTSNSTITTNNTSLNNNVANNKIVNNNSTSTNQASTTGSAVLTFINANTSKPEANTIILINGTSYTTNSNGAISLNNLKVANQTLTVSSNGFNNTTVKVNITANNKVVGKVNIYPTTIATNNNSSSQTGNTSSTGSSTVNNNNNTGSASSIASNNTSNSSSSNTPTSTTGSAVLTFVNANTLKPAANTNIVIDGTTYTTNSNGAVILNNLKIGNQTLTVSSNGFNNTTVMVNITANNKVVGNVNIYPTIVATNNNSNTQTGNTSSTGSSNTVSSNNSNSATSSTSNIASNSTSNSSSSNTPASTTGSAVLTFINANTSEPAANTTILINGTSYTTNSNGTITLNNLNDGNQTLTVSSNGYNNTSVMVNITSNSNVVGNVNIYPKANTTSNNNSNSSSGSTTSNSNVASNNSSNQNNNNSSQSNSSSVSNTSQSTAALQQAIVNYAEQFLGKPYVWGATGPDAFDCSGLTSYVYKHFGYNIGRTTYQQIYAGTPVSLNDLQPGDLLFFGNPSAPDHVVIYIGNHEYIQAPQPGQNVDISSWNWGGIVAARRIV